MKGEGSLNIEADYGIYAYGGDASIGGGTVNVITEVNGIYALENVEISGGTVDVITEDIGIHAEENVEISGGTVNVTAENIGIYANENVGISDGMVYVNSENFGINAASDDVIVSGGEVTIDAFNGIYAGKNVDIIGGMVDITAGSYGISAGSNASISGGTVDINSADRGIYTYSGNVTVTDSTVNIISAGDGIKLDAAGHDIRISGSGVSITTTTEHGSGIYIAGSINENDKSTLEVVNNSTLEIAAGDSGIYSDSAEVTFSDSTVNITADFCGISMGYFREGIVMSVPCEVSISGGSTTLNAGDFGIVAYCEGTVSIDGDVVINAGDSGINGNLNVTIAGGTVDIKAYDGISVLTMDVSGGETTIISGRCGIAADLDVTGGVLDVYASGYTDGDNFIDGIAVLAQNGISATDPVSILLPQDGQVGEYTVANMTLKTVLDGGEPADRVLIGTTEHSWNNEYTANHTHHWHECIDSSCFINSYPELCGGYAEHSTNGVCVCGYDAGKDAAVFVGGLGLAEGEYLDTTGNFYTTEPSDIGYAHYSNGVLTLNGYMYDGAGYGFEHEGVQYSSAIFTDRDLEIVLMGDSALTNTAMMGDAITAYTNAGSLTIRGDGKLHLDSAYGIYTYAGDVSVESGELRIAADLNGISTSGSITVSGGVVDVESGDACLLPDGDTVISGGNVTLYSDDDGIDGKGDVRISGGTLDISSKSDGIETTGDIVISDGEVAITSVGCGIYAQDNGDRTVTVEISGGALNVNAVSEGIYAERSVSISDGTVYIDAASDGIYLWGDASISGGMVTVIAGEDGIIAPGGASISGGTVTVDAEYSGIYTDYSLSITGGTIYIAASRALYEDYAALVAIDRLTIPGYVSIIEPVNGRVASYTYNNNGSEQTFYTIVDENGIPASNVILETGTPPPSNPTPTPPAADEPSGTSITVPISGEGNTIHVDATVDGSTATIDEVDLDHLDEVIGDDVKHVGTVTIDFSGLDADIDTVVLPADVIKQIADAANDPNNDAESLLIVLSDGTAIEFDAKALGEKSAQADGQEITIAIKHAKDAKLSNGQKSVVGDRDAYDISVMSGGEHISDMGGKVKLHLPYELRDGEKAEGIVVFFVDRYGSTERCDTVYDAESKSVIAVTDHLSLYMIGYEEPTEPVCPQDETCPLSKFDDVDPTMWYHDGVHFVVENGLMIGTSDTEFEPLSPMTRAMVVTILWRLEGEPVVNYLMQYDDVPQDMWYSEAVRWASAEGIVEGHGDGTFEPNGDVTREQLAAILHRYAMYKGYDVSVGEDTNILSYEDAFDVSDWAYPALQWACGAGILEGKPSGDSFILDPQGDALRAEVATMLMRFCGLAE